MKLCGGNFVSFSSELASQRLASVCVQSLERIYIDDFAAAKEGVYDCFVNRPPSFNSFAEVVVLTPAP